MSALFEELDWCATAMGPLSLRRRRELRLDIDVYEVMLGDEFLMSSLFTAGEVALARLGLADAAGEALDVVVGGLGLGYTARAVLEDPRVRSLVVLDALAEVIGWHERGLLPDTAGLAADPRCRLVHGDFFQLAGPGSAGLDPDAPGRRFHAILVDIDHTPRHLLHASHAPFYEPAGLCSLARHLLPGGVFALWSNDPPDEPFTASLGAAFATAEAHVVTSPNPLQDREAANTVYVARTAAPAG